MREELRYFEARVPRTEKGNKTGGDNAEDDNDDDTDKNAKNVKISTRKHIKTSKIKVKTPELSVTRLILA